MHRFFNWIKKYAFKMMAIKDMLLKELLFLSYIAVIHSYSTKKSEKKNTKRGKKNRKEADY